MSKKESNPPPPEWQKRPDPPPPPPKRRPDTPSGPSPNYVSQDTYDALKKIMQENKSSFKIDLVQALLGFGTQVGGLIMIAAFSDWKVAFGVAVFVWGYGIMQYKA